MFTHWLLVIIILHIHYSLESKNSLLMWEGFTLFFSIFPHIVSLVNLVFCFFSVMLDCGRDTNTFCEDIFFLYIIGNFFYLLYMNQLFLFSSPQETVNTGLEFLQRESGELFNICCMNDFRVNTMFSVWITRMRSYHFGLSWITIASFFWSPRDKLLSVENIHFDV